MPSGVPVIKGHLGQKPTWFQAHAKKLLNLAAGIGFGVADVVAFNFFNGSL